MKAYQYGVANPLGDTRTNARIDRCITLLRAMGGGAVSPPRVEANLFSDVM